MQFLIFTSILFALANPVWAQSASIKNCKVKFETTGQPVLVKIDGKSESPCTGEYAIEGDKLKSATFTLPLDKLDTGIALRNKHLRENYLHTEKFPKATLTVNNAADFAAQRAGSKGGMSKFEGELELHGQKAPVLEGEYQIKGGKVTAKFKVELPAHGVAQPSFMGVKIVDRVHLTVDFDL
ncbi:MAG: YceI family protein [Bdellovibrionaceae bacterium]|nr:YceI family protein [Pseudobdellovibrionaceae bacterium]